MAYQYYSVLDSQRKCQTIFFHPFCQQCPSHATLGFLEQSIRILSWDRPFVVLSPRWHPPRPKNPPSNLR